jgi:hypothetical protein
MNQHYRAAMNWEATVVPARLACVVIANAAVLLSQFWARRLSRMASITQICA